MEQREDTYKIIAATAIAAIGGILIGRYLWGVKGADRPLSSYVFKLGKVLEQIESIDAEEMGNLKESIENILTSLETSYGKPKEKPQ